jgi:hypothetical protein
VGAIDRRVTLARRRWLARQPNFTRLVSQPCTYAQITCLRYQVLARELDEEPLVHRKQWEWCFIVQALIDSGAVRPGARGLGFGVGREPIVGTLADRGCRVTATDLPSEHRDVEVWQRSGQHAATLADLDPRQLCDPTLLAERVEFRAVDMRAIPDDLRDYAFCWSACAFEHLGSLDAGLDFVTRSLETLRPGGIAVHTTEFNVSSNRNSVEVGPTVAYRARDLSGLARRLRADGHRIDFRWGIGRSGPDRHIESEPYTETHLRVGFHSEAITSFGLVIRRCA